MVQGWSIERSVRRFVLWGFSVAFLSIFGVQNWHFLRFADFGSWFWGAVCGGTILDLVPSLWGEHWPENAGLDVPIVRTLILSLTLIVAMTFILSNATL